MKEKAKRKSPFYVIIAIILVACISSCHKKTTVTVSRPDDTTTLLTVAGSDRYLIVPIEEQAAPVELLIQEGTKRVPYASVRLARTRADYYVPVCLPAGVSEVALLHAPDKAFFLSNVSMADHFEQNAESKYRPVYHYAPSFGWMGRPAAAVKADDGSYHVFYECNPHGSKAENFHWGHTVSKDLIHWTEQATAFGGDSIGEALGGSIVVDKRNVFGSGEGAWIAVYTATRGTGTARRQEQCLQVSADAGKSFSRFATNPVLRTYDDNPDFCHPGIVRYHKGSIWDMVVACKEQLRIYSSENLGAWNLESYMGKGWGVQPASYESAQLVELKTPDGRSKWVLLCSKIRDDVSGGSFSECFIGDFDGKTFMPDDTQGQILDGGNDYTGAMAFGNIGERCLVAGWLDNAACSDRLPSFPFRGVAALPRELTLYQEQGKWKVSLCPAKEMTVLRTEEKVLGTFSLSRNKKDFGTLYENNDGAFELTMTLTSEGAGRCGLRLYNEKGEAVEVSLRDNGKGLMAVDCSKCGGVQGASCSSETSFASSKTHQLRIFADRTSVEVFLDEGKAELSNQVFPSSPLCALSFFAEGRMAVNNLKSYRLSVEQ